MCLAVPHTIERILDHNTVLATAGSVQVEVRVHLLDSADIGDTVLVHAGFAIDKLEENDSIELQALWNEIHLFSEKSHVTL